MPIYNSKFTTSTEQTVAEAAAKAQRYAQDALKSSNAAEVYYNQMVGIGVQAKDFARLDGADFTGPVTFSAKPTVDGEELITIKDVGSTLEYDFNFQTYSELVNGGDAAHKKGTIYFIPTSAQGEANYYDEYMWVQDANRHELIGSTQIDLSGYATTQYVDDKFLTKTSAAGTYATNAELSGVKATADSLSETYSMGSQAIRMSVDDYSGQDGRRTLLSAVSGTYSFSATEASGPFPALKLQRDGLIGEGTVIFDGKFSFGDGVEWGLHALPLNEDGDSYGSLGYNYVCRFRVNSSVSPSRTTVDLMELYPSVSYSFSS